MAGEPCPCCGGPLPDTGVYLDHATGSVVVRGKVIRGLTHYQMLFLAAIVKSMPGLVTYEQIHTRMYGDPASGGPNIKIVTIYACKLRAKLAAAGSNLQLLTVWGRGFQAVVANTPAVDRRMEKNTGTKYAHVN